VITATIEARRGNVDGARALLEDVEESVTLNVIGLHADLCVQAAEAATLAGLGEQARSYLRRAVEIAGPLGYRVTEEKARARLAELDYAADAL
jgi:hypothetical protein